MSRTNPSLNDLDSYTLPEVIVHLEDSTAGVPKEGPPDPATEVAIADRVDKFNKDVKRALCKFPSKIVRSKASLLSEEEEAALPPVAKALLNHYAMADALAIHYRDRTHGTFLILIILAFVAVLVFELFAHVLFPSQLPEPYGVFVRGAFILYPLVWFGALLIWYRAHRREYQKRYQDYRALAEGLRVQFFWYLLGLPDAVEERYLRKQRDELEWIRSALRTWRVHDGRDLSPSVFSREQLKKHKDLVRRRWVED